MKKILILQLLLFACFEGFCQLNASFENDTLTVERDLKTDQTIHLPVNITGINPVNGASNSINFAINGFPATNMVPIGYHFSVLPITVFSGINQVDCPITIMGGENKNPDTVFISVQLSYNNPEVQSGNKVLRIVNKAKSKTDENKKNGPEIGAISIGHSFDFFGKSNSLISYADAYMFHPNSISIGKNAKEKKYGFAIKLYQSKSISVDSLNTAGSLYKFINQSLVNPLQPPVNDSVFLKQEIMSRKASNKSTNWGMYIRLFRDISYVTNDKTKFYVGIHGEFLRRDIATTYEYKTEKDTIIKIKASEVPYSGATTIGKNSTQSEFYLAPYIELRHCNKEVNIQFTLLPIGFNIYRSAALNDSTIKKAFFMGQFDLTINKINVKARCGMPGVI